MIRIAAGIVALVCGLAVTVKPGRSVVEGVSMAPGLRPGDIIEAGGLSQLWCRREPRRHERWIVVSPDGIPAIKRVAGLPGETVSIRDGDLTIGSQVVLTPPRVLAELASVVPQAVIAEKDDGGEDGWHATVAVAEVLDEADFAPAERRVLLPVRDVGITAVIDLRTSPSSGAALRARLRVGPFVVPWLVRAAGRFAFVAGRLDGRLVALAWPLTERSGRRADTGRVLPPQVDASWDVARRWPDDAPSDERDGPASFSVGITRDGASVSLADIGATIERVVVWRDALWRPAADGVEEWRVGTDAFFVLGDFPSGSRDSRQWGSLPRGAFRAEATLKPHGRSTPPVMR